MREKDRYVPRWTERRTPRRSDSFQEIKVAQFKIADYESRQRKRFAWMRD